MRRNIKNHNVEKIRFDRETKKLPLLHVCKCGVAFGEFVKASIGWRVVCPTCGVKTRLCPDRTKAAELWNKGDAADV